MCNCANRLYIRDGIVQLTQGARDSNNTQYKLRFALDSVQVLSPCETNKVTPPIDTPGIEFSFSNFNSKSSQSVSNSRH
jgi:hypothetical protein